MNTLVIKSSILSQSSSFQLVTDALEASSETYRIRDLVSQPIPYLTEEVFLGFREETPLSETQQQARRLSDELIEELKTADRIILTLPMYNFDIPAQLKSYFDFIARAGVTFKYTAQGPIGLLPSKPLLVVATRGGRHLGTERDGQSDSVTAFLNFVGLSDQTWVYAEGLSQSELQVKALKEASHSIGAWVKSSELILV